MKLLNGGLNLFFWEIENRVHIKVQMVTICFPAGTQEKYSFLGYLTKNGCRGIYYSTKEKKYFFGSTYLVVCNEGLYDVTEEMNDIYSNPYGELLQKVFLTGKEIVLCKGT